MTAPVSVVMPTYGRASYLPRILAPLLDDLAADEIVVVVDGSPDDSVDVVQRMAAHEPRLRVLTQANAGAAAARQAGVEAARHPVVLLIDDDVLAEPGLVTGHATVHAEAPGHVVIGYMPTPLPTRRRGRDLPAYIYSAEYEHACQEYAAHPDAALTHLWTGNVSLPRELALRVGLRDPDGHDLFPFDDRDLGLRLRAGGVTALFRRDLRATHLHERSIARLLDDASRQGRAMVVLHDRHPVDVPDPTPAAIAGRIPPPVRWLVFAAARFGVVERLVRSGLLALTAVAGALHLWHVQRVTFEVVRRCVQARAARTASRRPSTAAQRRG